MLTLYIKDGCPYCAAVLHKIDELGTNVNFKNIKDDAVVEELIEKGGKRQVPFLVDDETGTSMYESADIIQYLDEHIAKGKEDEA